MSNRYLIIDSRPYGLFSIFLHTIDCFKFADDNNYIPIVRWGNGRIDPNMYRAFSRYTRKDTNTIESENFVNNENIFNNTRPCLYLNKDGDNVWEYYFEPVCQTSSEQALCSEHKISDIFLYGKDDSDLENKFLIKNMQTYEALKLWDIIGTQKENEHRKSVNDVINKYVRIKKSILKYAEEFYINRVKDHNIDIVIGVHVRGTDKKTEYPFKQLTLDDYIVAVQDIVNSHKDTKIKIYVASDNNEAILKFISIFGSDRISAYPSLRLNDYTGSVPICLLADIDRREHGEQTLLEMLILSRSDYIIGTDSNLTATASYFNPQAKLIFLNRINGVST